MKGFIDRIIKFAVGGISAETNSPQKQGEPSEKSPANTLTQKRTGERLEKALSSFSLETQQETEAIVKQSINYESLESPEKKERMLLKYAQVAFLVMTFNGIYNNIYGSQIKIIQKLNSSSLVKKDELILYYDNAKVNFPKVYENYPYSEYLKFLINSNLIQEDGDNVIITKLGRDFLKFIVDAAFSFEKLY